MLISLFIQCIVEDIMQQSLSIRFFVVSIISLMVMLPGCLFQTPDYHIRRLPALSRPVINYHESKRGVSVWAKELDYYECQHLFDGHGGKLFKGSDPIYPIQITIENRSDSPWEFSPQDINLRLCDSQKVVDKINWSPVARGLGILAVGGLAIWGAKQALGTDAAIAGSIIVPVVAAGSAATQAVNNNNHRRDLDDQALTEDLVVYPYQRINTYIFVKARDYRPNFNITMYNLRTDESMRFRVQL